MRLLIKSFILFLVLTSFSSAESYNYVLICTGHNCTPCVKTADDFFHKNKTKFLLINLYGDEAEKEFTNELIQNYCSTSTPIKTKKVKDKFKFGHLTFFGKDNGPFVIKYSKTDTVVFNSVTIDQINY